MDSKKEYKKLVETVKNLAKSKRERLTNEEIAKRLGYNRSYFSTLMGSTGKVEQSHIEDFKLRFQYELAGITKLDEPIKPGKPGDPANMKWAMLKTLYRRIAKSEAARLGLSIDQVIQEMDDETMLNWRDLEKAEE